MKFPRLKRSTARTTLLGVAALGTLLWAAVSQLGLSVNSLVAQFLVVGAALLVLVVAAAIFAAILTVVKRDR